MPKVVDKTVLTQKSQVTIPKKIREVLNVGPGDMVRFEVENGVVKIFPVPSVLDENFGSINPHSKPEDFGEIRKNFERQVGEDASKEY